jgi:hypothetical protein
VPPTLLFKNGVLRFAYTSAIFVPDGADPNDCLCCGESQCPVCDDYTYGETEVVLSGWPASFTYFTLAPITNQYRVITVTGLDAINGTYNSNTDVNCVWGGEQKTINYTETVQNWSGFGCGLGSINSTTINNYSSELNVGSDSVAFEFGPFSSSPYRFRLKIGDRCIGGTDSNFFALGSCPGGDTFTGTATWTPTLV